MRKYTSSAAVRTIATTTATTSVTPVIAISGVRSLRPRSASCASSLAASTGCGVSGMRVPFPHRRISHAFVRPSDGRRWIGGSPRGSSGILQRMAPDRLWFTDSDEANALNAKSPMALLIGFAIDQQVPVQKAFTGPLVLRQRVGTLDPKKLAGMDLHEAFRERPAIHRFPGAMADRVRELAAVVADEYGGEAERIWTQAAHAGGPRRPSGAPPRVGALKGASPRAPPAKRF